MASVARTLADLRLEEPLADAEAVAQMRRHMKSMQTTWQTSSVHESLRQILLEQGARVAFTPCPRDSIHRLLASLRMQWNSPLSSWYGVFHLQAS